MKTQPATKKFLFLLPMLSLILGSALAQKQATFKPSDNKSINVELRTDEDGNTKTFKKTYNTKEEMRADEELKTFLDENNLDVHFYEGDKRSGLNTIVIDQSPNRKGQIHILSNIDSLKSFSLDGSGTFQFNSTGDAQSYAFQMLKDSDDAMWMFNNMDSVFTKRLTLVDIDSIKEAFGKNFAREEDNAYFFHLQSEDAKNRDTNFIIRKRVTISKIEENEASIDRNSEKDLKNLEPLEISYYPNPNSGRFTLRMSLKSTDPLKVSIMDLSGKMIHEEEIKTFDGTYSKDYNLSEQPAGIYLLQVLQGKSRLVRKIMIN